MAQNLWELRRSKKMKVRDLAARSGVPAPVIHQYEAGETSITQPHLRQLARALIVETWDIKLLSDPKPRDERAPARPKQPGEPRPARKPKEPRPPMPARPTQIAHLLRLAERFPDVNRETLEAQAGKPLEELMVQEAAKLLGQIQERIRLERPPRVEQPFERHRPYLPESVDGYELKYLTQAQAAGDILDFTLFDGSQVTGQILGFSPYTITLKAEGEEITLNKLALAHYRKRGAAG